MLEDRIIRTTFVISLIGHCLFLGLPGLNLGFPEIEKPEEITVKIEIERPILLPKIDVMGDENKIKEIESPQPEFKETVDEIVVEEPELEPLEQVIEVTNPQEEAMLRYQDMVKQKIESCRRYPTWAMKQGLEGIVNLTFIVTSDGEAIDIKIVRSSGFQILDNEAVYTLKRANPFPPIPKKIPTFFIRMEVSIVFTLR